MMEDASRTTRRPEDRSSRALFGETVDHVKGYLAAEKQAVTLRVKLTVAAAKSLVLFGTVAAVGALFGIGWLLVAAVGALSHLVGHTIAAAIIGAVLLLAAYLSLRRAMGALNDLPGAGA